MTDRIAEIRERVYSGTRLSFEDGVHLDRHADLHTLGELANVVRERKNGNVTYFNVNEHLNPTNVCVYRCTFCAFRADLKSPKGFVERIGGFLFGFVGGFRSLRLVIGPSRGRFLLLESLSGDDDRARRYESQGS